jgi:predicted molibdopterin-dependent oxidoreductase YjgC
MGALPTVFSGYQRVDNAAYKTKFESAWGCVLDGTPGLTLTEIFDAAYYGSLNALYVVGENPVLSEANADHAAEALRRVDFLVVQDIFMSETAALADVVLPAASFAEKEGTVTNTERRIQLYRRAINPKGASKPDWLIACELAKRLGGGGFDYQSPAEIMAEIAVLTPIYGGVSYERLQARSLQWPCPDAQHPGTPILHVDKFATPDGKGRFVPLTYRASVELPDGDYPFVLTTGRNLFHYHTGTMTRRVEGLNLLSSREWLEINPLDAADLGVKHGESVRVVSRRGELIVRANLTNACPRGVVYMTFHHAECPTNRLTSAALDPVAKIPETKVCAVRLEKAAIAARPHEESAGVVYGPDRAVAAGHSSQRR